MILRALNVILKTLNAKPMGMSKIESYYVKSNQYVWNEVYEEITKNDLHKRFKKQDKRGYYTTIPLHPPTAK